MKSKGFTLIELMVVLLVIGLLAGLLYPAISRAREKGRQAQCANNLKELHAAVTSYLSNSGGRYPFATTYKYKEMDELFHERKGWVGPRVSIATDSAGAVGNVDMWDDGTFKGSTCITNGTLYPYVTDKRIYACPTFVRDFTAINKTRVPVRNYVMNWNLNWKNIYTVKNGSKIMLFTELNHSQQFEKTTVTLNWILSGLDNSFPAVSASEKMYSTRCTDGALENTGSATPLEAIAAYHNGKGNVVFADGHIEYLSYTNTTDTYNGNW
jgi:prepilin-type N-terminal cleavage/methylation domain-containing protein/prepilin-type processing-associated H-X9-DG protein